MFSFTNGASDNKKKKNMGPELFMNSTFCYGLSNALLQKATYQIVNDPPNQNISGGGQINCIFPTRKLVVSLIQTLPENFCCVYVVHSVQSIELQLFLFIFFAQWKMQIIGQCINAR